MGWFNYKPKSDPINWEWGIKRPNNDGWWYDASCNFNLTQEDVRLNAENIHWHALSENHKFPFDDEFLAEFEDKIFWNDFVATHRINEKTFLRFRKYISVYMFLKHTSENKTKMAEKYFEQAENYKKSGIYYWDKNLKSSERLDILQDICGLSDKFLETHCKDEDDWYTVSCSRRLKMKFIKKNWDKLDHCALLENSNIDDEVKEEISGMMLQGIL